MATERKIDPTIDHHHTGPMFQARYDGVCGGCGSEITAGDLVFYDADTLVGDACCAGGGDLGAGTDPPVRVMPRGKTARDKCPRCFIVHATGQVECE